MLQCNVNRAGVYDLSIGMSTEADGVLGIQWSAEPHRSLMGRAFCSLEAVAASRDALQDAFFLIDYAESRCRADRVRRPFALVYPPARFAGCDDLAPVNATPPENRHAPTAFPR